MRKKRKKETTSGRDFMEIIDDVSRHAWSKDTVQGYLGSENKNEVLWWYKKDNGRVEIQCYCRLLIIMYFFWFLNKNSVNNSIDDVHVYMKEYVLMVAYGYG